MDAQLKFLARSKSVLKHATERTEWKCDHCPRVKDTKAEMLKHLLENHRSEIDVEEFERRIGE